MLTKATVSIWNRDHEDGSYTAEKDGWKLAISYTPEPPLPQRGPCGFSWVATSPESKESRSSELLEEPEMAMMQAEQAAGFRDAEGNLIAPKAEGAEAAAEA